MTTEPELSRVERYLQHLDSLTGGLEPEFWPVDSTAPGHRGLTAITYLAEGLRHECPFRYGDTLNFGEPIASGSSLDGFVVFAPLALDQADAHVEVGDDLPIKIVGMYPTHASERAFIQANGLEAFWKLDWDPYDVGRPPAV